MERNLGVVFLLISVLFILITDNMVKKGRILDSNNVIILKVVGTILLFISIGILIVFN